MGRLPARRWWGGPAAAAARDDMMKIGELSLPTTTPCHIQITPVTWVGIPKGVRGVPLIIIRELSLPTTLLQQSRRAPTIFNATDLGSIACQSWKVLAQGTNIKVAVNDDARTLYAGPWKVPDPAQR